MHQLTAGSVVTGSHENNITISLTVTDMDELKRKQIARDAATTWMVLTSNTLLDMFGQSVVALVNGQSALGVTNYVADTTSPELVSFDVDMTAETITMTFSETVRASTLSAVEMTMESSSGGGAPQYTLTAGSTTSSADGTVPVYSIEHR